MSRRLRRVVLMLSFILFVMAFTFFSVQYSVNSILQAQSAPGAIPPHTVVFEGEPGPDIPTLHELAGGATTDAEILQNVTAYYEENRERLQVAWREDNPVRLAGLFAMYISHISHVYGPATQPATIVEFLAQDRAHCGTLTFPQVKIATDLGLTYRSIEFVDEHAWVEIYVDDHWELFDATTNVWINRSGLELLEGAAREYRGFYTPLFDADRPDARWHIAEGFNMQTLRRRMPLMGVQYFPPGERKVSEAVGPLAETLNTST